MPSNNTSTQQTTPAGPTTYQHDPYAPAAPYLSDIMGIASSLYGSGAGTALWGGGANAPLNQYSTAAFGNAWDNAQNMAPTSYAPWQSMLNGLQSNGMPEGSSPFMATLQYYANNPVLDPAGYLNEYHNLQGQTTAADQYLGKIASGTDQTNPFLQQLLDANATRIANRAASLSSGAGRYGSAGMYDALNRSIAETNNPIMYQSAEAERNRQLQAAGQIDAARMAQQAARFNALQGVIGVQGQNIQNRLGAANNALNFQNLGANRALQWGQLAPEAYQIATAPYSQQMSLANFLQSRDQQDQALAMQQFQQANMMPWQQLQLYLGGVSGLNSLLAPLGSGMGTQPAQTVTNSAPTPWTTYAGLGLAGLGAAGSLGVFCDCNAKTDIEFIGVDPNTGIKLYAYRYKSDPKTYPKVVGPMAQDVAEMYPHMVGSVGGKFYIKA